MPLESPCSCKNRSAMPQGPTRPSRRKRAHIGLVAAALLITLLLLSCGDQAETPAADGPEMFNARGNLFAMKGQFDQAIQDFNRAIELKPDYAEAYVNRGAAHMQKGDLARAIEDYSRAIELQEDLADAYSGRGAAHRKGGDLERAMQDLNRAIELNPDLAGAYVNRGNVYCQKGETSRGIEDFDRAIELEPELAEAHVARRSAYNDLMRRGFSELAAQIKQDQAAMAAAKRAFDAGLVHVVHDPAVNQLITAAREGDVQRLDQLLASGVDADATNEDGDTALVVAAGGGHVDVVRRLLKAGADPNRQGENGMTVLFLATGRRGSAEIVRLLLEAGADPNIAGMAGAAPLHRAAIYGNLEFARLLVEAGADPSREVTHPQAAAVQGKNAIYMALQHGHTNVAQYLADKGAELDIWTASALGRTQRMGEILDADPTRLSAQGRHSFTPLHFAAVHDQPGAAELLLKRGVAPDVRERRGRSTALHLAAGFGHEKVAAVLLEHGADPNATNASGKTPLNAARRRHGIPEDDGTISDRQAVMKLLEEHGAE